MNRVLLLRRRGVDKQKARSGAALRALLVAPAKAGAPAGEERGALHPWVPAFAGMTECYQKKFSITSSTSPV
jgi:hypothetical protein